MHQARSILSTGALIANKVHFQMRALPCNPHFIARDDTQGQPQISKNSEENTYETAHVTNICQSDLCILPRVMICNFGKLGNCWSQINSRSTTPPRWSIAQRRKGAEFSRTNQIKTGVSQKNFNCRKCPSPLPASSAPLRLCAKMTEQ